MLFKLLYLPSPSNMTYSSSTCDSSVYESTGANVMIKLYLRRLFLILKNQLVKNYQNATKAQIDSLIP